MQTVWYLVQEEINETNLYRTIYGETSMLQARKAARELFIEYKGKINVRITKKISVERIMSKLKALSPKKMKKHRRKK